MLNLDYYQAMKRVTELAKKGFLKVINGSANITNEGVVLKEILGQVIVMMHRDEVVGCSTVLAFCTGMNANVAVTSTVAASIDGIASSPHALNMQLREYYKECKGKGSSSLL